MKKFNSWLSAISIVFLITTLVDINLYWLHHPANNRRDIKITTIVLSILLAAIVIRAIVTFNKNTNK